jgi:hypothetical protein
VRVVDRHVHLRDRDRLGERDHEGRREGRVGHAHVRRGDRSSAASVRQSQQPVGDGVEADLGRWNSRMIRVIGQRSPPTSPRCAARNWRPVGPQKKQKKKKQKKNK